MNRLNIVKLASLIGCCCLVSCLADAQSDSTAKVERQSLIYLQFHLKDNRIPYITLQTKNKLDKAFLIQGGVNLSVYLDKDTAADALIGEVKTNNKGEASIGIPGSLAGIWGQHAQHTFYAHSKAAKDFGPASEELSVSLGKIEIDTLTVEDGKEVAATVLKREGDKWIPLKEVDVKLAVKRYGGNLNIGDEETYTTDSAGKITGIFKHKDLPGDSLGNLQLVAVLDDNEEVGTLETGMIVPWGKVPVIESSFGERTLWATGRRAPIWLMVMAYGCIIAVWSVIIYLIRKIIQIKKLAKSNS